MSVNTNNFNNSIKEKCKIIKNILAQDRNYPKQIVNIALNAQVGNIENMCLYSFFNYDGLKRFANSGDCKNDILVIQISETQFAVPYVIISEKIYMYSIYDKDKEGKPVIDYETINGIHRDLNKLLKIFNVPVHFKGIKKIRNHRISAVDGFSCNLHHTKLDINSFNNLVDTLFKYMGNPELPINPRLEDIIDITEARTINDDTLTFTEYLDYVYGITGTSLLSVPNI